MLSPQEKAALADIYAQLKALEVPLLIIGAGARLLVCDLRYNIAGRSTKDWDFAIKIATWDRYDIVCTELTQGNPPVFRATSVPHRFVHLLTGTELDIVPFGPIGEPDQEITWPNGNQMSVLGLEEALIHAEDLLIDDIRIKVVTPPALIILKLIAWSERRVLKDLEDVAFVLKYHQDDRIYDLLADELAEGRLDFGIAANFLLGRDIQAIFTPQTLTKAVIILRSIVDSPDRVIPQLIRNRLDNASWNQEFDEILQRFQALQQGMAASVEPSPSDRTSSP
jgi:predicted nucleotidyltransferase